MERSSLRKKVLLDLLSSPWTLLPLAAGLSSLLLAWAAEGIAGALVTLGIAGVLAGLGALATRWILGAEEITRRAFEGLQAQEASEQQRYLDELDRRLQGDEDPGTEASLRELRRLYEAFRENRDWTRRVTGKAAFEIARKVESLFRGCVRSLERSLELWRLARKMRTEESRRRVLELRQHVLQEIRESNQQMARTLDAVYALAVSRDRGEDLARIRRELNESLEVARRVDERMEALEEELAGPGAREDRSRTEFPPCARGPATG